MTGMTRSRRDRGLGDGEPQWSPAEMTGMTREPGVSEVPPVLAAMEPGRDDRDDGSQYPSLLTCGNAAQRERLFEAYFRRSHYGLVKVRIWPVTCLRALPGPTLTTGPLATVRL